MYSMTAFYATVVGGMNERCNDLIEIKSHTGKVDEEIIPRNVIRFHMKTCLADYYWQTYWQLNVKQLARRASDLF